MERRMVVKIVTEEPPFVYYESRKPAVSFGNDGEWENEGRKYDLKGLDSLLKGNNFDFILGPEVLYDLGLFRIQLESKKRAYQK